MRRESIVSPISITLKGAPIAGADDRQKLIPGWDQQAYSKASVVCIGAGGLISHIAPTLVRKGIGKLTLLDDDIVEASNLNRQRFYIGDLGKNKAVALAQNLERECIAETEILGIPFQFGEAMVPKVDLRCDVAICGVDNNPSRVASSRHFRQMGIPVVFTAVSRDGDHGYVFIQERRGACIGCLYPEMADDHRYPCPGTPAIADILQVIGALAVYAVDTLMMKRQRTWNYRRLSLSDAGTDGASLIRMRPSCSVLRTDNSTASMWL